MTSRPATNARAPASASSRYDALVVGAGVIGLWAARHLSKAGLSVAVCDRGGIGGGASGGYLGALIPHMPSGWNPKKQFQLDALLDLPDLLDGLRRETGIDAGYARCGRISPIRRPGFLRQSEHFGKIYPQVWGQGGDDLRYGVTETKRFAGWIDPDQAPMGLAHETLAARVKPRAYMAALEASLSGAVTFLPHTTFEAFDPSSGVARLKGETDTLTTENLVLTAGHDAFHLLAPHIGAGIGSGVGGEVAVFAVPESGDRPIIYDDGVYIVPQAGGRVAVGSTSLAPGHADADRRAALDTMIAKARSLCPPLRHAEPLLVWSGIRPRCHAKDPLVGQVPATRLFVATGGFRITLGIGHRMAQVLAGLVLGSATPEDLPPTFRMDYHLAELDERLQAGQQSRV